MTQIGIFDIFWKKARTDEEYWRVLRNKLRVLGALMFLGNITWIVSALAYRFGWGTMDDHSLGFYCGVGVGLVLGGVAQTFRIARTLRSPEKLHRQRMEDGDERRGEIARRALAISGGVLITAVYLTGIIGGLFYPILFKVLLLLAAVFFLTYVIAWNVLNKKM